MITRWKKVKWFFKKPLKVTVADLDVAEQQYVEIFKQWCGSDSTAAYYKLEPQLDKAAKVRYKLETQHMLWKEYCKWKGIDYD